MERRDFLKNTCGLCLMGTIGGAVASLASCSPAYPVFKTEILNNQVKIPINMFDTSSIQFVRPKGWYYDIVVERNNGAYNALLLKCTHQDNGLNINGNNGYTCSVHGSTFDKEGHVRKGPAEKSLRKYPTKIEGDQLLIYLNMTATNDKKI